MSITLQGENRVSLESPVFLSTSSARLFILSSGLYTIYKLTKKQLIGKFFKSFIQDKKKFCLVGQKSQEKKKEEKKNPKFEVFIFFHFSPVSQQPNIELMKTHKPPLVFYQQKPWLWEMESSEIGVLDEKKMTHVV